MMATRHTIMWVVPRLWVQHVGHTHGARFFDAVKLNPKDTTSIQIAAQMDELFEIDAQARKQGLKEDRQLVKKNKTRLEKSKPLLEEIKFQVPERSAAKSAGSKVRNRLHDGVRTSLV